MKFKVTISLAHNHSMSYTIAAAKLYREIYNIPISESKRLVESLMHSEGKLPLVGDFILTLDQLNRVLGIVTRQIQSHSVCNSFFVTAIEPWTSKEQPFDATSFAINVEGIHS